VSIHRSRLLRVVLACTVTLGVVSVAWCDEWQNPKANKPPRAKPHRRSAAESLPPLPLPATPLRRSERKRQPAPPALVGMVNFSESKFAIVKGQRKRVSAFPTTQIDIERLMKHANSRLRVRYRFIGMTLDKFSWNPAELPLLYITGWTPMPKLSDELIAKLRRYLYDGGTLVVHAQCGRKPFRETARVQIARILPERRLAPVDTDSPLFNAFYPIKHMRIRRDDKPFQARKPYIEAVYLGCRPAIIYSPVDLNCGWDVVKHPIVGDTMMYHQNDALTLGVNIVATVLANFEYARAWGTQKIYPQQGDKTRGQLVIAQVSHDGDWDPTPHALPSLMKHIQANTTLDVQFKRDVTDLGSVYVSKHPVLYMTGLRDFKLTANQVARLRSYLASGGVLIADAAAGRAAFDEAFRREIKRVLPDAKLKSLPQASPVYQMPNKISAVDYTALVKTRNPKLNAPALEGITVNGQLAVIYSPMSLSNGWEKLAYAYNRGYANDDSIRLGVNVFAYALTH